MPLPRLFADDIRALRGEAERPAAGSERERIGRLAERAARSSLPVLIEGEPGSGAPALARAIHDCGERRERAFVRLHAGEAAGRQRSQTRLPGAFKDANGGTPVHRRCRAARCGRPERTPGLPAPAGRARAPCAATTSGSSPRASTSPDRCGRAAFARTSSTLSRPCRYPYGPCGRSRRPIADWAHRFIRRFAADEGKRIGGLSAEAGALLARYDWPGNLRQLENAVYRAVILAEGLFLTPTEFPQIASHLQGRRIEIPPLPVAQAPAPQRLSASERTAGRDPYCPHARRRCGRHVHARRSGGAGDSLRACPLSRTHVGDFAASGNRTVDSLQKIERTWPRR